MEALDPTSLAWLRRTVDLRTLRADLGPLSDLEWLGRFGLARSGRLTRAAVLLCGDLAATTQVSPVPRVDYQRANVSSDEPVPVERWADRVLCDGNLVQALTTLLDRFDRLLPNPFALEADGVSRRAHGPHLPALREALVNLLVHQDHGDRRTARIRWYTDRVVFENAGDALVSPEELTRGGTSTPRNPLLLRIIRVGLTVRHSSLLQPTSRATHPPLDRSAGPDRPRPA